MRPTLWLCAVRADRRLGHTTSERGEGYIADPPGQKVSFKAARILLRGMLQSMSLGSCFTLHGCSPRDKFSGLAGGGVTDNVRRAGGHHRAALGTAARAHINDVVCVADHIQVMLNDDDGGAVLDQGLEHAEQNLHIRGCRPMVGSSKTNRESDWALPISLASFRRWASPPERLGVSSPRVR